MSYKELNGMYVDTDGTKRWYKDDMIHRDGAPAVEWTDGTKLWYNKGRRHRLDGPAYVSDEALGWYVNGKHCTSNKQFQELSGLSTDDMVMLVMRWGDIG